MKNFTYTATFPTLINIQNTPTYFMTLLDDKGLIKNYGFVNVENFNIVGVGETIQKAYSDYIQGLSRRETTGLSNNSELEELTGVVTRFAIYNSNSSSYVTFMIEGKPYKFIVPIENSLDAALTNIGDNITVKYIDNNTNSINVNSFTNNTLK